MKNKNTLLTLAFASLAIAAMPAMAAEKKASIISGNQYSSSASNEDVTRVSKDRLDTLTTAKDILGSSVYDTAGEKIGDVKDISLGHKIKTMGGSQASYKTGDQSAIGGSRFGDRTGNQSSADRSTDRIGNQSSADRSQASDRIGNQASTDRSQAIDRTNDQSSTDANQVRNRTNNQSPIGGGQFNDQPGSSSSTDGSQVRNRTDNQSPIGGGQFNDRAGSQSPNYTQSDSNESNNEFSNTSHSMSGMSNNNPEPYVFISVGGLMGIGDDVVRVPMSSLSRSDTEKDRLILQGYSKEKVVAIAEQDPREFDANDYEWDSDNNETSRAKRVWTDSLDTTNIREALMAKDGLGAADAANITVEKEGENLVLSGSVKTESQKKKAEEIAKKNSEMTVKNEIKVNKK